MPRKPVLTEDTHLHENTPEHVYRVHHGLNPQTGEPVRGCSEPAESECGCAHCVSHVQGDEAVLTEAKEAYAAALEKAKTSKKK